MILRSKLHAQEISQAITELLEIKKLKTLHPDDLKRLKRLQVYNTHMSRHAAVVGN